MRRFQITAIWEDEAPEKGDVEEQAYSLFGPHYDLDTINLRVDVIPLPREAGGTREQSPMGAPDGVTHPWDQGLWIFPDSHPFARLERHAREQYNAAAPADGERIKKAVLELDQ